MKTTFTITPENFNGSFSLDEINTLGPGVYHVRENGAIKHHHDILITNEEIYYVASFDRVHDADLYNELYDVVKYGVQKKSVVRHPLTWGVYAEFSEDK